MNDTGPRTLRAHRPRLIVSGVYLARGAGGGVLLLFFFCFFNDTATTEIYPLSLHDALPICVQGQIAAQKKPLIPMVNAGVERRSEEHTSELQSPCNLVCRLLLEKKKTK